MTSLLELSHELLHCIFSEIDPVDLSSISRSCTTLHSYIRGNRLLHKDLYVRRYDEPVFSSEPDWENEVHNAVGLERVLQCEDRGVKREHLAFVADQVVSLLWTARAKPDKSSNLRILNDYFEDQDNIDTFLCSSSLFARGGTELQVAAATPDLQQASAKLHCLYGKPIDPVPSKRCSSSYALSPFFTLRHMDLTSQPSSNTRLQTRGIPTHTIARSKVYDLREYTDSTLWGPFMSDGSQRVDWEKVEAIMLVLGFNLSKFHDRSDGRFPNIWDTPFVGATPRSYSSQVSVHNTPKDGDEDINIGHELQTSLDELDPYGVTGTWMRVVCFLDYNDLYAFNFSTRIPAEQPREPIDTEEGIIDLEEFVRIFQFEQEADSMSSLVAIRLIKIKLQVTHIEPSGDDRLPVVYFRGTSRSLHASWDPNANSRIRGSVQQTPEGEIRWTTFSIFHGEERWRSEGIQVGGLRSARGVLGNWFDKDYDIHGPAGPTAFWKITDELAEEKSNSTPIAFF